MNLTPVDSSVIAKAGYADGTLALEFTEGDLYFYVGVPHDVYQAFTAADSKGQFFNQQIRGQYDREKISADDQQ